MAEDDRKLLIGFEGRLRHFIYLYGELKKENLSLKQLLSEKEAEIDRLNNRIKELEDMYANLKSARIISINDNELKDTRQRLMKLVREVDKCIALLNEEQNGKSKRHGRQIDYHSMDKRPAVQNAHPPRR